jgi:hypothetical protein
VVSAFDCRLDSASSACARIRFFKPKTDSNPSCQKGAARLTRKIESRIPNHQSKSDVLQSAGVCAALLLSRLLVALVFNISPADLATLLGDCAMLLTVAVLADGVPARPATCVDPFGRFGPNDLASARQTRCDSGVARLTRHM